MGCVSYINGPKSCNVVASSIYAFRSFDIHSVTMVQFSCLAILPFLALLRLSSLATAFPQGHSIRSNSQYGLEQSLPVAIVHQFPVGTDLENLAVRRNGKILATCIDRAELHQIDPLQVDAPAIVSNSFGSKSSLLGIVETHPDLFYVVATTLNATTLLPILGSNSVWTVDLTSDQIPAPTRKIADFPDAVLLNGMALLSKDKGLVLVADSIAGAVWRLNVLTGEVRRIIDIPALHAPSPDFPLGVNGIKVRDGTLYFTNSGASALYRLPIHEDGTAAGNVSVVASGLAICDDFILNRKGDAFVALHGPGELVEVTPRGMKKVLVGNSTITLPAPSAVKFGRTPADRNSLYITEFGNSTMGGRLSRVDLGRVH